MTERKPPRVRFESWIDQQIRTAQDRGEFENLPGAGKPIPGIGGPHDEMWWVKNLMRRENLSTEALLPTSLQLRKEIERLSDSVLELGSEDAVHGAVADLNRRILDYIRIPSSPLVLISTVDANDVVAQWHADRAAAVEAVRQIAVRQIRDEQPSTTRERGSRRSGWWPRKPH